MGFAGSAGYNTFRSTDFNATAVNAETTARPMRLHGWAISNSGASAANVKIYNKGSATQADTPKLTFMLPAGASANVEFVNGIIFDTGMCVRAVTEAADNGTTAPTANSVYGTFFYS